MDIKQIIKAIEELNTSKKKFTQSFDLLVALKDLNLKNPDEQVEFFTQLPNGDGKKKKICALVGPEMIEDARAVADKVIVQADFAALKKQEIKKIAAEFDFFLGQANVMPKIAQTFGRFFGPRGKMPNPKSGCIVPPKTPLQPLYDKLQNTVKVSVKKQPNIQLMVGKQDMKPEELAENIMAVYDQIIHHLPKENNNVKSVYLKLTMSKPIKLM